MFECPLSLVSLAMWIWLLSTPSSLPKFFNCLSQAFIFMFHFIFPSNPIYWTLCSNLIISVSVVCSLELLFSQRILVVALILPGRYSPSTKMCTEARPFIEIPDKAFKYANHHKRNLLTWPTPWFFILHSH